VTNTPHALAPEERPTDPQRFYEVGATAFFAAAVDQRFSYTLYVPRSASGRSAQVAVLVHDTMRTVENYRAAFTEWAERTATVLLLPLFPAGVGSPFDLHGYKYLEAHGVRYDLVLIGMLDEAAAHFGLDVRRFLLYGFSGGAQFAHRFAMLYPERIRAVSVAAPGGVTIPRDDADWWVGTADSGPRFGRRVGDGSLVGLRVQTLVGDADVQTWEVSGPRVRSSPYWMPGGDDAGPDRVSRVAKLGDAFEAAGAAVTRTIVAGAAHDPTAMFTHAIAYFDAVLAEAGEECA
jgi:pimeloyl-ACP methyl ester carboxylesterase